MSPISVIFHGFFILALLFGLHIFWTRLIMKVIHKTDKRSPANQNNNNKYFHMPSEKKKDKMPVQAPLWPTATCLLGFYIMVFLGYINKCIFTIPSNLVVERAKHRKGYPSLQDKTTFLFFNYYLRRIKDCFHRPISSAADFEFTLMQTSHADYWCKYHGSLTGVTSRCVNFGSFNYLAFAKTEGPHIRKCEESVEQFGVSTCNYSTQYGLTTLHLELERVIAEFFHTEDAAVFGQGFGTNFYNLPCLLSRGTLVFSDQNNHMSIVLGVRVSGASCIVFRHNDMTDLESKIRKAILTGQPNSKPWKKIYVIVEGVYSMDGTMINLPSLVALKEKYKFYIYIDEAHSIGTVGPHGRGVTDYYGIDPKKVDILMGTLSKSFGANGGYIAGSKKMIDHIRRTSHDIHYSFTLPVQTTQYILSVLKILMDSTNPVGGMKRVNQLRINSNYFRWSLEDMGLEVSGNDDSPVVPLIIYSLSKLYLLNQRLLNNNIAVVLVTFPATSCLSPRLRFCISAHHTKQHLDKVIKTIDEAADELGLRYNPRPRVKRDLRYENIIKL